MTDQRRSQLPHIRLLNHGEVQGRKDPTEIGQRPCLDPQQLQPTKSAMSTAVISSRRTVLPPWPSGVNLRPEINRLWGSKTCPRLSDSARNRLRRVMSFCELKLDVIRSRVPFSTGQLCPPRKVGAGVMWVGVRRVIRRIWLFRYPTRLALGQALVPHPRALPYRSP